MTPPAMVVSVDPLVGVVMVSVAPEGMLSVPAIVPPVQFIAVVTVTGDPLDKVPPVKLSVEIVALPGPFQAPPERLSVPGIDADPSTVSVPPATVRLLPLPTVRLLISELPVLRVTVTPAMLMVTLLPFTGTAPPDQFEATLQLPLAELIHVTLPAMFSVYAAEVIGDWANPGAMAMALSVSEESMVSGPVYTGGLE